jgi:hypothetical protein
LKSYHAYLNDIGWKFWVQIKEEEIRVIQCGDMCEGKMNFERC